MNLFDRLKSGLSRTRSGLVANLESVFAAARQLDVAFYEELEDTLIMADVGVASTALISRLQRLAKEKRLTQPGEVKELLQTEIEALFATAGAKPFDFNAYQEGIFDGGSGSTGWGKQPPLPSWPPNLRRTPPGATGGGDTFRAAATEQLMIWGERLKIPVIHHQEGADPAAVVFDGMAAAKARKADVIIVDTAGGFIRRLT